MIFHTAIPQKPVLHMSSRNFPDNIKRGCNVNVETMSALVTKTYTQRTCFISSRSKPIIGLIELFQFFHIRKFLMIGFDRRAKFTREIDTAKLTGPFIASHLLWSLEGQSVDRYSIVEQDREEEVKTALYFLCFESMRERCCILTLSGPTNIVKEGCTGPGWKHIRQKGYHFKGHFYLQYLSQQQEPEKKKKTELTTTSKIIKWLLL